MGLRKGQHKKRVELSLPLRTTKSIACFVVNNGALFLKIFGGAP